MVYPNDFCQAFSENYLCSNLYFNEYKAISEVIDNTLKNIDLYTIKKENEDSYSITYRCDVSITTRCTIVPVLSSLVRAYHNYGWLVSYNENTGDMHFQIFAKVNKKTGKVETVAI